MGRNKVLKFLFALCGPLYSVAFLQRRCSLPYLPGHMPSYWHKDSAVVFTFKEKDTLKGL